MSSDKTEPKKLAKVCTKCKQPFTGLCCKPCKAKYDAERKTARLGSDFEALKPEDFEVSIANGERVPGASAEKRQEFNARMGELASELAASGGDPDGLSAESGEYVGLLAEQERRFGNRRSARTVSLQVAHEALNLRLFKQAAREFLADKITPSGYAARDKPAMTAKRAVVLLLSDLHLGAELSSVDNPMPYRAIEEARRLEYVIRQALDYKPQYRERTECVLLLNGDLIDGMLLHDLRDGSPLTEQKVIFWRYFRDAIGLLSQQFPSVRVFCQPGNHGRDKVRHPGRATSSKWDGHEWQCYYALGEMCSGLPNVKFDIGFQAVTAVDLFGSKLLLTHGDTEVKFGDPDTKATANADTLDRINARRLYGVEFAACAIGHFHKPRYRPGVCRFFANGALIPPNGYARGEGYIGEVCGQFLWEAVEGYPVGDVRFIEVGAGQDRDEKLGTLIKPFRFDR